MAAQITKHLKVKCSGATVSASAQAGAGHAADELLLVTAKHVDHMRDDSVLVIGLWQRMCEVHQICTDRKNSLFCACLTQHT